jgi:hypothetical protein
VFENRLLKDLKGIAGVDGDVILDMGVTELRDVVAPEVLGSVLWAYDRAVREMFLVALVMACLAVVPALGIEWESVKAKQVKKGQADNFDAENSRVVKVWWPSVWKIWVYYILRRGQGECVGRQILERSSC